MKLLCRKGCLKCVEHQEICNFAEDAGDLGKMGNKVSMQSIQVTWLACHTTLLKENVLLHPITISNLNLDTTNGF